MLSPVATRLFGWKAKKHADIEVVVVDGIAHTCLNRPNSARTDDDGNRTVTVALEMKKILWKFSELVRQIRACARAAYVG